MSPVATSVLAGLLPGLLALLACTAILPWLDPRKQIARVLVLGVSLILLLHYVRWRCLETLPSAGPTFEFTLGLIFLAIELLACCGSAMSLVFLGRTRSRSADVARNMLWLSAREPLPRVDVLICTYNEEAAILERTITGAASMSYSNMRIWVCDDGRRTWLEEMCNRLGVGYLTRTDNKYAKAGNINSALARIAELPDPPEFIAILDADFVPLPQFLLRAMTLFRESDVAVVQTPQHFSNPDPIQRNLLIARHWPDEQRFFFDVVMASKDAWNAAFCCGTSSVLRYSALMEIGGFPTESVTEDYFVTLRLLDRGYRTIYLNECLSLGLAPEGLAEYLTQRSRWCLGFIQIFRSRSGPWWPANRLPLAVRLALIETFLYWFATHLFRLLALIVPALYLIFDLHVVQSPLQSALEHFVPFFVVHLAVMRWLTNGRLLAGMADVSQLIALHEILRAVAVGLFKPKGQKFKVTAKGGDRSRRFVQWHVLRILLALLAINVAAIAYPFLIHTGRSLPDSSALALFWSWYNIIVLIVSCYVCIELPRVRRHERFDDRNHATLRIGDRTLEVQVADISQGGARVSGATPIAVGQEVELDFAGVRLPGRIARCTAGDCAIAFHSDAATKQRMFSLVYSGRYSQSISSISGKSIFTRILARIFE